MNAEITVQACGLKAKSKKEMYRLLVSSADVYLPPVKETNYEYIRDILVDRKLYIKASQVKPIHVIQINELSVKEILNFAEGHFDVHSYLPNYKKNRLPNRVFLCNIVNTVMPKEFQEFIDDVMRTRERRIIDKKNFKVSMKPEFLDAFTKSNHISYERGKSHFLLRSPKRLQVPMQKYEELKSENNIMYEDNRELKNLVDMMKEDLKHFDQIKDQCDKHNEKLSRLFQMGVIDADANPININDKD